MSKQLRKRDREACWASRDAYFKCLDENLVPNIKIDQEKKIMVAGLVSYFLSNGSFQTLFQDSDKLISDMKFEIFMIFSE